MLSVRASSEAKSHSLPSSERNRVGLSAGKEERSSNVVTKVWHSYSAPAFMPTVLSNSKRFDVVDFLGEK